MDGAEAHVGDGGERELLAQLRAGHAPAYTALMRRNNQRLFRLARGVLGDDAEAEEAVQEGYLRAFTALEGFTGEASLATWLSRIVINEALGRLRKRPPTVDIEALAELPGDALPEQMRREPSPEQAMARREIGRAIEQAIDALPPNFRSVFMLRAVEQMSIEETAACLGIPGETVKTRLHRANKLLRQALTQQFGVLLDGAFPFLGARCDRLIAAVLSRLGLAAEAAPPGDRPAPPGSPP